jgi:hypothetical protein
MLYCIEVEREMEEKCVLHTNFDHVPTREEILKFVIAQDMGYNDDYGRIEFYEV